jgi:hypothetical protein
MNQDIETIRELFNNYKGTGILPRNDVIRIAHVAGQNYAKIDDIYIINRNIVNLRSLRFIVDLTSRERPRDLLDIMNNVNIDQQVANMLYAINMYTGINYTAIALCLRALKSPDREAQLRLHPANYCTRLIPWFFRPQRYINNIENLPRANPNVRAHLNILNSTVVGTGGMTPYDAAGYIQTFFGLFKEYTQLPRIRELAPLTQYITFRGSHNEPTTTFAGPAFNNPDFGMDVSVNSTSESPNVAEAFGGDINFIINYIDESALMNSRLNIPFDVSWLSSFANESEILLPPYNTFMYHKLSTPNLQNFMIQYDRTNGVQKPNNIDFHITRHLFLFIVADLLNKGRIGGKSVQKKTSQKTKDKKKKTSQKTKDKKKKTSQKTKDKK